MFQVVSGGQTGVDRAALDAAREAGLAVGGWCPRGRRAMDGRIPDQYPLIETPSAVYEQRTEWNVRDSDGTLILDCGPSRGGTALTARSCRSQGRPTLVVDLALSPAPVRVSGWIRRHRIGILNVAGPREEECPGIYGRALAYLRIVFSTEASGASGPV